MVRNVKIISVFLAVVLIFSFPLSCFAAEDLSPGESLMWDNFFNTLGEINKVAVTCPKCGAGIRKKDGGTCPSCGFNASIDDGTVNNYRPGFEAGGGSASPGGVGRFPKGYSNDLGGSNISKSGKLVLYTTPNGISNGNDGNPGFYRGDVFPNRKYISGASGAGTSFGWNYQAYFVYDFVAPVTGVYYISSDFNPYTLGSFSYFNGEVWVTYGSNAAGSFSMNPHTCDFKDYAYSITLNKGEHCFLCLGAYNRASSQGQPYKYSVNSVPVVIDSLESVDINQKTSITINNNTFNGNIYVDNTNKLTYIYPQYTVNNETKISNNPIIYNEETKQYYTYDSVTNNYYYITYGDPAPTPTSSPSPDPGGTTPDPDKPSPTPTPGGSGGDGSGGGSGDTPSGGGSSWWEKLLDKLGSALIDGLLDAIKGILKLLFDLFSSILGWIIWLCSKVFDLFPFLPPGVGALLVGGVVVCFILAFIKFIRG